MPVGNGFSAREDGAYFPRNGLGLLTILSTPRYFLMATGATEVLTACEWFSESGSVSDST